MEGIFGALNFNGWTFLFQVINLFIVIGLLYVILHKPVLAMVAGREERIETSLARAAEAKKQAEEVLADYQQRLTGARQETQELFARAQRVSEEMKQEIIASAQNEAEKILVQARAEIESERFRAVTEIRREAAGLAVLVAGRLLERSITVTDQEKLLKEFEIEVGQLQ